jgi:hypothetical protein
MGRSQRQRRRQAASIGTGEVEFGDLSGKIRFINFVSNGARRSSS